MTRGVFRIYADGGARGNPGPAAIGVVVCDADDAVLEEYRALIGTSTNNVAEYRAIARGLDIAARRGATEVEVVSDSELVVRQLRGEYRVREERLGRLHEEVRDRAARFARVTYSHRPRLTGHLRRADDLVNEALDERPG